MLVRRALTLLALSPLATQGLIRVQKWMTK